MPVTVLSIDESPFTAAVFRWTLEFIEEGETLVILSCANPIIPPGKSGDNFGNFYAFGELINMCI